MNLKPLIEVIKFIRLVRESVPNSVEVFTKGNCTSFSRILEKAFPGGKVMHSLNHSTYKYGELFYDITGVVDGNNMLPLDSYSPKIQQRLKQNNYEKTNNNVNVCKCNRVCTT